MYLATMTCPYIAYTMGVLARFNSSPGQPHWKAVKHLFHYLKGIIDLKLEYDSDESIGSEMFVMLIMVVTRTMANLQLDIWSN